ncbi:MAG TPA: hypothetical protein VFA46_01460 [Actinomycetes bacterium]|jgi:hypothetical protein|nr:hypothetical protein [Actinomycetes bacterium]
MQQSWRRAVCGRVARVTGEPQRHIELLPSQQLRDLVRHASAILQDAGLTATPLEQLDHQRRERLAAARLAVTELASRQRVTPRTCTPMPSPSWKPDQARSCGGAWKR